MAATTLVPSPANPSPVVVMNFCFDRPPTISGTAGNDNLEGTPGRDVIVGRGGNDRIDGAGGSDLICGNKGDDRIVGGYGNDVLAGGDGNDKVFGGPGDDHLEANLGTDQLYGGDGRRDSDSLVGGSGHSSLFGGDGRFDADYLFAGTGSATYDGGDGAGSRDILYAGGSTGLSQFFTGGFGGRDTVSFLFASAGVEATLPPLGGPSPPGQFHFIDVEALQGSDFDDALTGNDGPNELLGMGGNDRLNGGAGNDSLIDGGPGDDALLGGEGRDKVSFLWSSVGVDADLVRGTAFGAGQDVISQFEDLRGSIYDDALAGDDGPNSVDGWLSLDELLGRGGDDELFFGQGDAGDGRDTCYAAFGYGPIENCELFVIADPFPFSTISTPTQAQVLEASDVTRVEASAGFQVDPSRGRVDMALRSLTAHGCSWWNSQEHRFEVRSCGLPRWNRAELRDDVWTLRLAEQLSPGWYLARSRIVTETYREKVIAEGANQIDFRITPASQ